MSDDERLAALFRDAASDADAPAPTFDHSDVVATSRRITARRRAAVVAAAAVIGLAGAGAAVYLPTRGEDLATSAASPLNAPEAANAPYAADDPDAARDSAGESGAAGSSQGSGEAASAPPVAPPAASGGIPLGPADGQCAARQDPALRRLVEQVVPEAAAATPAATTDICLNGADRYLALQLPDGVLSVSYLAPGSIPAVVPGALVADTASGGTLIVHSTADRPGAPSADRLPELVAFLVPRL
jgi:hypothetical protein